LREGQGQREESKRGGRRPVRRDLRLLLVHSGLFTFAVLLALEVAGCRGGVQPVAWSELGAGRKQEQAQWDSRPESRPKPQNKPSRESEDRLQIVPRNNKAVARLGSDDVVKIMQRVGFSDGQILELGTDLHDALLQFGAAEVYYGQSLEMILAVNNQQVQIHSRARGSFVYDLVQRRFVIGSFQSERAR
jgi:hypothetical protein